MPSAALGRPLDSAAAVLGTLGDAVVDFEAAVGEKAQERVLPPDRMAEGFSRFGLCGQLYHNLSRPIEERDRQ